MQRWQRNLSQVVDVVITLEEALPDGAREAAKETAE